MNLDSLDLNHYYFTEDGVLHHRSTFSSSSWWEAEEDHVPLRCRRPHEIHRVEQPFPIFDYDRWTSLSDWFRPALQPVRVVSHQFNYSPLHPRQCMEISTTERNVAHLTYMKECSTNKKETMIEAQPLAQQDGALDDTTVGDVTWCAPTTPRTTRERLHPEQDEDHVPGCSALFLSSVMRALCIVEPPSALVEGGTYKEERDSAASPPLRLSDITGLPAYAILQFLGPTCHECGRSVTIPPDSVLLPSKPRRRTSSKQQRGGGGEPSLTTTTLVPALVGGDEEDPADAFYLEEVVRTRNIIASPPPSKKTTDDQTTTTTNKLWTLDYDSNHVMASRRLLELSDEKLLKRLTLRKATEKEIDQWWCCSKHDETELTTTTAASTTQIPALDASSSSSSSYYYYYYEQVDDDQVLLGPFRYCLQRRPVGSFLDYIITCEKKNMIFCRICSSITGGKLYKEHFQQELDRTQRAQHVRHRGRHGGHDRRDRSWWVVVC